MKSQLHIDHEKRVVELMIRIFCRKKEKNTILCPDCVELLHYAHSRLDRCPFGEKKKACKQCAIHCYKPAIRSKDDTLRSCRSHTAYTQ